MKKRSIETLSDRQVVTYAIGEVITFVLLRLIFLALIVAAAWWAWGKFDEWRATQSACSSQPRASERELICLKILPKETI